MSNITVCVRFRPLNAKERGDRGDSTCIQIVDDESFIIKDEKEEDIMFGFDRVFYEESHQAEVYEFLALPIVRDVVSAISGTIITYGQTGAGKTYTMEGPNITSSDEQMKGLLPRVVDGLFDCINSSSEATNYKINLSMVEIYMEKIRDLYDLAKDNLQIKESKVQGILLPGVTEISVSDPAEALRTLSKGIANRAVEETQMNTASSRSHCVYMFTVQKESISDKRARAGKLVLVDLAGSEKVDKTGAEGRIFEEAKTINKSLSALGNVINALTCSPQGKANHIPYRDSKLTRILQDALGGYSQTALLCCCSPSTSNAAESLSTLRFGGRAKHVKTSAHLNLNEDKSSKKSRDSLSNENQSCEQILQKLREKLDIDDVKLLEQLFVLEGILFDPETVEDLEMAYEDITIKTISSLEKTVRELLTTIDELQRENRALGATLKTAATYGLLDDEAGENAGFVKSISSIFSTLISWVGLAEVSRLTTPVLPTCLWYG